MKQIGLRSYQDIRTEEDEEYERDDEEKAERYANENKIIFEYPGMSDFVWQELKQAFLAGLKEGRPKWHKVADGDLPKDENDVLVYSGEDWRMCVGRYSPKYKAWETV